MELKAGLLGPERLGRAIVSRHLSGVPCAGRATFGQARLVIVCMGRNDGASGGKRRSGNRNRRKQDFAGPATDGSEWYAEAEAELVPSSSSGGGAAGASRSADAAGMRPSAPAATWERAAGSNSNRTSGGRQQGRRGRSRNGGDDDEEDDDEDTRGWWERPEERNLQSYAAPSLEPWQEERLQRVYAEGGRRKAQIQDLARELDVDRSVVLGWFKEFALRPQSERDAIVASRKAELQRERKKEREREAAAARKAPADAKAAAAADAWGGAAAVAAAPQSPAPAASKAAGSEAPTGFVPFYLRKLQEQQQGGGGSQPRRLKGEVLRTLESIYDRTPFPSADVIRGLYELHRLPRETATEWFAARRAADGIASSTQRRGARTSLRERDRDLQGAFSGGPEGGDDDSGEAAPSASPYSSASSGPGPGSSGSAAGSASSLLAQLGSSAASAAAADEPTVVTLSRREMAALRSSLPSPNKHKGRMMAEKMGVKTGPGAAATQIGNVQYVQEVPTVQAGERMRASWRYRAAAAASTSTSTSSGGGAEAEGEGGGGGGGSAGAGAGGRRLRLRTRGADRGGRRRGGAQGDEE